MCEFLCLGDELLAAILKLLDSACHLVLLLLSHKSFAHSVCNAAFVERLVCLDSHSNFIAHSDQKESSLGAVNSDLTDKLIEALGIELLTNRTDTSLSGLTGTEPLVELFLEVHYINFRAGRCRYVTDPQISCIGVLPGRKDRVQVILVSGGATLLESAYLSLLLLLSLLVCSGCAYQLGHAIYYEGIRLVRRHCCFEIQNNEM